MIGSIIKRRPYENSGNFNTPGQELWSCAYFKLQSRSLDSCGSNLRSTTKKITTNKIQITKWPPFYNLPDMDGYLRITHARDVPPACLGCQGD